MTTLPSLQMIQNRADKHNAKLAAKKSTTKKTVDPIQVKKEQLLEVVSANPSKSILSIVESELNKVQMPGFINSLIDAWFNRLTKGTGTFSEKQAYFLAKFLIENK